MSRRATLMASCFVALAVAGPLFGQEHRQASKLSGSGSSSHHVGKIMPANAIEVLDPGVDPRGEPKAILRATDDGGLDVEIPPTVHVHRYFPSGPREFQAQYFAGGPTIVSVCHPFTRERVNVHLDLPPGYPKMKYEDVKIEYKYPEESFCIHFAKCGHVTTSYSRCGAVKVKAKEAREKRKEKLSQCSERLGITEVKGRVGKGIKEAAAGTTDQAGQFVKQSGNLFITAVNLVPGVQMLKSAAEDRATKERDLAVKRVSRERARAEADISTLR